MARQKLSPEVAAVKSFCRQFGMARLAYLLGYKTTTTLSHWIINNQIPAGKIEKVMEVLNAQEDFKRGSATCPVCSGSWD